MHPPRRSRTVAAAAQDGEYRRDLVPKVLSFVLLYSIGRGHQQGVGCLNSWLAHHPSSLTSGHRPTGINSKLPSFFTLYGQWVLVCGGGGFQETDAQTA